MNFWSYNGKANIPPAEHAPAQNARISCTHGNEVGTCNACSPQEEGAEAAHRSHSGQVLGSISTSHSGFGFPRSARITQSAELEGVKREGKRIRTVHLDVRAYVSPFVLDGAAQACRVGVIVPKYAHSAVERNLLKRRLKELVRLHVLPHQLPVHAVIRARPNAYETTFAGLAADIATVEEAIRARAERYRFMDHALVVGRGLNYSNAFEFALKMMETCYVVAERFSSADLMHGPIAMVNHSFPAFLFAPPGVTWPSTREPVEKLHGLGAETLVITDRSNKEAKEVSRAVVLPMSLARKSAIPVELFTPIPYIVPAQLFAAHLASIKGLNPDEPRTLSKVTKTM